MSCDCMFLMSLLLHIPWSLLWQGVLGKSLSRLQNFGTKAWLLLLVLGDHVQSNSRHMKCQCHASIRFLLIDWAAIVREYLLLNLLNVDASWIYLFDHHILESKAGICYQWNHYLRYIECSMLDCYIHFVCYGQQSNHLLVGSPLFQLYVMVGVGFTIEVVFIIKVVIH